jgi:hypothetical protein
MACSGAGAGHPVGRPDLELEVVDVDRVEVEALTNMLLLRGGLEIEGERVEGCTGASSVLSAEEVVRIVWVRQDRVGVEVACERGIECEAVGKTVVYSVTVV